MQSKLLPHKLSFGRRSTSTWDRSQAMRSETPSHPFTVAVQPSAISSPTCSFQPETSDDYLSTEYTTVLDNHSSYDTAGVDADMPDYHNGEVLTACCNTNDATHSVSVKPNITPTAGDSTLVLDDIINGVEETPCLPPQTERHSSVAPSQDSSTWSLSPTHDSVYPWSELSPPPTHFLRALKQLDLQYGLKNVPEIIELSDHFLREDAVSFIDSFRNRCCQSGLWYRPPLSNPVNGSSLVERTLQSLRCAETVEDDDTLGPVRLRMARVLLYQFLEQKVLNIRKDRNMLHQRSRGKDVPSIVMDLTLDGMYGPDRDSVSQLVSKRRRESLKTHKQIGKRWSLLASHLGIGILLTCDPSLATYCKIQNTRCTTITR
jgi:hypothetical protein